MHIAIYSIYKIIKATLSYSRFVFSIVLQIKDYIQTDMLKEAYLNLLSLRLELQREQSTPEEGAFQTNLVNKEKDLSLLYGAQNVCYCTQLQCSALTQ